MSPPGTLGAGEGPPAAGDGDVPAGVGEGVPGAGDGLTPACTGGGLGIAAGGLGLTAGDGTPGAAAGLGVGSGPFQRGLAHAGAATDSASEHDHTLFAVLLRSAVMKGN
jgi:hypothetical protein